LKVALEYARLLVKLYAGKYGFRSAA
jgi:hypothetical protein